MKQKLTWRDGIVNFLSFWAQFGVSYVVFRYVFSAGHFASSFAYVIASINVIIDRIGRK